MGVEVVHFLFGNADQHDGLVMFEHVGIDDGTRRIKQDLHVDRLAGVSRHVGHVDTLESIAVDRANSIGKGPHLILALRLGNLRDLREELRDALLLSLVLFGLQRQAGEEQEHCDQQILPPIANKSRRTTQGLHITPLLQQKCSRHGR